MERFFYGHDQGIEKYLTNIEGEAATVIRKIVEKESIYDILYTPDQDLLSYWIFLQDMKTRWNRECIKKSMNEMKDVLKVRFNIDIPSITENDAIDIQISSFNPQDKGTKWAINTLSSKKWILLVNKSDLDYCTSDHPIVRENLIQYRAPKLGYDVNPLEYGYGYQSSGLELRYPLSPKLCLLLINEKDAADMVKLGHFEINGCKLDADINDVMWMDSHLVGMSHRFIYSGTDTSSFINKFLDEYPINKESYYPYKVS
jgi:hypothetical protein